MTKELLEDISEYLKFLRDTRDTRLKHFVEIEIQEEPMTMLYKKWKPKVCHVGKSCWCREIITVDGDEVVSEGRIDAEFAEYICKIHNYYLVVVGIHKNRKRGDGK